MSELENKEVKEESKKVIKKNEETLNKNTINPEAAVSSQIDLVDKHKNSVLNKLLESDKEYEERLARLRSQDIIHTYQRKLPEIKIDGCHTHWASTDPKTTPSIQELKQRGYKVVPDQPMVETGHQSIGLGSGYHILMAIPNDLYEKRKNALDKKAFEDKKLVFQEKIEHKTTSTDYLFQKNTLESVKK